MSKSQLIFLFNELKKYFKIIVIISLIAGLLLATEKYFSHDYVARTNNSMISYIIKLDGINLDKKDPLKLDDLMKTSGNLESFIVHNDADKIIDFDLINANWESMSSRERVVWLSKIFSVHNYNDGVYEVIVKLDSFTPKDQEYLKGNADRFLGDFINQTQDFAKKINPDISIRIIDKYQDLAEPQFVSKQTVIGKYFIIGILLGGLLSVSCILIRAMGKYKNDN